MPDAGRAGVIHGLGNRLPRHPISCVRPDGKITRETAARALELVASNQAGWSGHNEIRMRAPQGHGSRVLPEFGELVADTAHWIRPNRVGSAVPEMTAEKREFLHAMKRL